MDQFILNNLICFLTGDGSTLMFMLYVSWFICESVLIRLDWFTNVMDVHILYEFLLYDQLYILSLEQYFIYKFYIECYTPIMDPWIVTKEKGEVK